MSFSCFSSSTSSSFHIVFVANTNINNNTNTNTNINTNTNTNTNWSVAFRCSRYNWNQLIPESSKGLGWGVVGVYEVTVNHFVTILSSIIYRIIIKRSEYLRLINLWLSLMFDCNRKYLYICEVLLLTANNSITLNWFDLIEYNYFARH